MSKTMKSLVLILGILLAATVLLVVVRLSAQRANAARIRITSPTGINELTRVTLGGIEQ